MGLVQAKGNCKPRQLLICSTSEGHQISATLLTISARAKSRFGGCKLQAATTGDGLLETANPSPKPPAKIVRMARCNLGTMQAPRCSDIEKIHRAGVGNHTQHSQPNL